MGSDLSMVSLLARREIEAGIVGPLLKAFINEIGEESVVRIVRAAVESLARETGAELAGSGKGNNLTDFARVISLWNQNGALEFDILEESEARFSMNVTRCRYAEMYAEKGMKDLGYHLSCSRDFALVEGFNPEIRLSRTQTIMEGAEYCDFRFVQKVK